MESYFTSPISPSHNQPEYTVSEISGAVKKKIEQDFGFVRVKGEISECKLNSSGHMYLTMKDEGAALSCVVWRGSVSKLGIKPEQGLEVVATGRMTTFPGASRYQLVIEKLEASGLGALMALLEKRKAQLMKEGLFDEAKKKALPAFPRKIGVITSPTGAVIRDILHRITDRYPVHVVVWPVAVQGERAAQEVADAIHGFNSLPENERPDLLIVARGGGSVEDLWAFNEEVVVRAVHASNIVLISAIGHETDTTLIDFVSDRRAPTPTAAAEMAVPVRLQILEMILDQEKRLLSGMARLITESQHRLKAAYAALPHPRQILEHQTQKLDIVSERLANSLQFYLKAKNDSYEKIKSGLRILPIKREFNRHVKSLQDNFVRLNSAYVNLTEKNKTALENILRLIESFHYERVLERGFALVRNNSGELVTSATKSPDEMEIQFKDGTVKVSKGSKSAKKKPLGSNQESLF